MHVITPLQAGVVVEMYVHTLCIFVQLMFLSTAQTERTEKSANELSATIRVRYEMF